jgi:hypothetical protein
VEVGVGVAVNTPAPPAITGKNDRKKSASERPGVAVAAGKGGNACGAGYAASVGGLSALVARGVGVFVLVAVGLTACCADAVSAYPPRLHKTEVTSRTAGEKPGRAIWNGRASRTSQEWNDERRACRAGRTDLPTCANYITGFVILCQRVWRFFADFGLIFLTFASWF